MEFGQALLLILTKKPPRASPSPLPTLSLEREEKVHQSLYVLHSFYLLFNSMERGTLHSDWTTISKFSFSVLLSLTSFSPQIALQLWRYFYRLPLHSPPFSHLLKSSFSSNACQAVFQMMVRPG